MKTAAQKSTQYICRRIRILLRRKLVGSTLYNPIFRIPLPPLNQAQTTRTAATADCRSPAGQRQPGQAPLFRHPATQQSGPQIRRTIFPDPPGSAAALHPWLACARLSPPAAFAPQAACWPHPLPRRFHPLSRQRTPRPPSSPSILKPRTTGAYQPPRATITYKTDRAYLHNSSNCCME